MATIKKIQAQNKILKEKLTIDFNPIVDVIIEYRLTGELISMYNESKKEVNAKILQKVSNELTRVKGIKPNSTDFNKVFALALNNLGDEYIEDITNEMNLKRAEGLVLSFENAPTKDEIIDYFKTLNDDDKIVDMFYNNFMMSCYDEFNALVIKYENAMDKDEKVGK